MNAVLLQQMAVAAVVAGTVTALVTPPVRRMAIAAGVVREARKRDVHTQPTPLWGGVAIIVGFLAAFALVRLLWVPAFEHGLSTNHSHPILGILIGALLVATVGLFDDKGDLKPWQQMLSLLTGGLIAALFGARIEGITNPLDGGWIQLPMPVSIIGTMAWIFLAAKTFDFLDGLDGLAAGICAICATTMGLMAVSMRASDPVVGLLAAAVAGSCIGFLRHNYNPASIFMGTVGAQFLGFLLASLAVVGAFKVPATISVIVPILVLGVPILDAFYVVIKRVVTKAPLREADQSHIHHRLRKQGLSVRQAVWTIYGLTACTCAIALLLAWRWGR